ncbi:MAG: alpha-amylase family glycosyl hydrolase [Candidatus Neomarinimicrobiota bacterium]
MPDVWWKSGIIYQIYPRSFSDSNGDGIGDLSGIIGKLDYLNDGTTVSLGVDAIWLSPVYPSPQVDFGYDVADYCAIDPLFGDLTIFSELVQQAHERGIRIIMDLVLNHTSDQHPWFIESRSTLTNPRRDWYIWRSAHKGGPPNNWGSYFGGSAWRWDEHTGQYYLAMFTPEQPDLNWRNPAVRKALLAVVRFWLDLGVDGFRLDVFNQYYKDAEFRSNPRTFNPLGLVYRFWGQQHVYDRDQPEMYQALTQLRQLVDSYPERMLVGETSDQGNFMKAIDYYGHNNDGLHLAFSFDFLHSRWRPGDFRRAIRKWEDNLPQWAWPTYVLSNHDVSRHFSRYGRGRWAQARAKIAATLLLTLRGTPTLYYGEELGQADIRLSRKQILDPPGRRFWPIYKGRDGCRAPMQWDRSPRAGFTTGDPWLPVNSDYMLKNIAMADTDPDSLLNFYRRLIWLRKQTPALHSGRLALIDDDHRHLLAYQRFDDSTEILIILNFSQRWQQLALTVESRLEVLLGSHWQASECFTAGTIDLRPHEIIIAKKLVEGE